MITLSKKEDGTGKLVTGNKSVQVSAPSDWLNSLRTLNIEQ